jgi:DNA invertase Pin-like site-specific DNA recombinase
MPTAVIYLRLSDLRTEESLDGREAKLRAFAANLGWLVHRVVTENDVTADGRPKRASAWKRRKIMTPSGRTELRVIRPKFREVLDDLTSGRANAVLAEDLDRVCRDPRDLEDLIDACEQHGASARSISGSLKLTDGGDDGERFMARVMVAQANKSSADTSRRCKDAKERLHGKTYYGGLRPYGFAHVADTEKYHRTLLVVPDEADVLRQAAADILDRDISLAAITRELRGRGILTVTGKEWTSQKLRQVLLKPAISGQAAHTVEVRDEATGQHRKITTLKPAPWPAILDPDLWAALVDKLTDPARRVSPGNEPRWLLSGIATCGACGSPVRVAGHDGNGGAGYACQSCWKVRRNARYLDAAIEALVIDRLSRDDVKNLLRPPVRQGIDTTRLKAEAARLRQRKARQMHLHSAGQIDDDDLVTGMADIRDRLDVVQAQLAACAEPDPLAEFRGDEPAEAVWRSLPLARKRAIVRDLMTVTLKPTARRGPGFDPKSVEVEYKPPE